MGCAQSKIDNEEAVSRCKDRKRYMKEAVAARNAFAAAHSGYVAALKNTGAALSEYGQGELIGPNVPSPGVNPPVPLPPGPPLPASDLPPPPPPPSSEFPPPPPSPLQRSSSMPELPHPEPPRRRNPSRKPAGGSIREEDGEDEEDEDHDDSSAPRGIGGVGMSGGVASIGESSSPAPPPPPPREQQQPLQSQHQPPAPPPPRGPWDYFFELEHNMPGSTLDEPEEIGLDKDHRMEEEQYYRKVSTSGASTSAAPPPVIPDNVIEREVPLETPEKVPLDTPPMPPKPVKKPKQGGGGSVHHSHAASLGALETKKGKAVAHSSAAPIDLMKMLMDLDEHFLRASESAQEVSKKLEATRLHYHSNFADNRGHIDHSARVMKVITWNRSFKGMSNLDDGKDDFNDEEWETLATILDKLLAWEKKLYDEVKAGEIMKIEYQRKAAQLNKQKKHNANSESLERTKAAVSHLHTRLIVDMQSLDSTVSEIQRLRDHQLYPKLVELVEAMAQMWEEMHRHHADQANIVADLRALDISSTPKETTPQHYKRTEQLYKISTDWHGQFHNLVTHQKVYIEELNNWLKLNLIPVESNLREKPSSPEREPTPAIQPLLVKWHEYLGKLQAQYELAGTAISSFAAVINTVMLQQEDELKMKQKCEETRRELSRKERAFTDWLERHKSRTSSDEVDPESGDNANHKDPVRDREFVVDTIKKRLEMEEDQHRQLCKQVREKAVASMKSHLPELFRVMSEFSGECAKVYMDLRSTAQRHSAHDN